jgi:outer membrane protein assembly factor BamD (BamD/ComL family)
MSHVRSAIVVGVLCALAGTADAQPARYRRNQPVHVGVDLSERTRPKPRAKGTQAPPRLPTGEEILAEEGEKRDLREQTIELLRNLIDDTPDSEPIEKADLYFRLADTLAQLARFHRLEGVRLELAGQPNEGKQHGKQSVKARKEAEKVYQTLTTDRRYRAYPRMDRALFSYAFALQQSTVKADRDRSREVYETLLTEHPASKYVPHAYLAFADYFFEQNQLGNAASFYEKVLKFPTSNVHTYARFMLGWVHLNSGDNEGAGREFLQVVRDTAGDAKQASLHGAAKRDFVRAFSEFGDVRKAWAMLRKLDSKAALGMMETLANLYVEKGKSERAVYAYRQLIKEAPDSPHVCAWQHDIAVELLTTPGTTVKDKVDEIVRLVELHRALASRKTLPPSEAAECAASAAAMSGELARAFHNEGAKTFDLDVLAAADRLYGAYLGAFPGAADWGESAKFQAELAWMRADKEPNARRAVELWEDAAAAFTRVVKARNVAAPVKKDAASGAVDAWRNALAIDPVPVRLKTFDLDPDAIAPGTATAALPPPRAIPPREASLLAAVDDYLAYVTEARDPERVALAFVKARILRNHDHHSEAMPLFEAIIRDHPGHEVALYAAHLVLNAYVTTRQHGKVTAWGAWFADHPAFFTALPDQDRSDLQRRVEEINRIADRIDAQECEVAARKTGDFAQLAACGNRYLAIFNAEVKRDPSAGVAEKLDDVLYNAGVLFEDGRSLSAAIDVYTELRQRFPASPAAARALARLGNVYARVAYYDRASSSFEEYARKYAGEADAFEVMNDAVIFRKGLGHDEQAIADTAYFVKKFGGKAPGAAADAFFSMASILEKRGELDEVVAHYRAYLAKYGARGGGDRVVVAYARIGQILWDQACPVALVDGSCVKIVRERAIGSKATRRVRAAVSKTQCGPPTKLKVTLVKRDPKKAAAAMAAFAQAIAEYERRGGTFPGGDARAAKHSYALARFHRTETTFEEFLAVRFPDGLDFDPAHAAAKARSDQRLNEWFQKKDALAGAAAGQYLTLVKEVKDPAMAIAGAARVGQIAQTFSDALYTAEIPAFLRPYEEAVDLYCTRLETEGDRYEDRSVEAFGACLKAATDFGWFSSWSRLCERELGQIRPEDFPTSAELRAAPDALASVRDLERPIIRID